MKILLIGNYPLENTISMPRYAEMLRREMSARGHQVRVLQPRPVLGRLRSAGLVGKWLGYADRYLLFPFTLRRVKHGGWDALHVCDQGNAMYLRPLRGTSVEPSITCHDMLAIHAAEGRYSGISVSALGRAQQRWIKRALLRAHAVVAVSEKTASNLREASPRLPVVVINQTLAGPFYPEPAEAGAAVRAKAGVPAEGRYLLHVGGNTWYKHRTGVLRIFAALRRQEGFADLLLVMAGQPWTAEMRAAAAEAQLGASAIEVTNASDSDLRDLYNGADALLFPSLGEGFGWPVLEAQSCGCAVVTSDLEPLTDVAGCAALFIDPADTAGAALQIAGHWSELQSMRASSLENARRFDGAAIMDRYEAFFAGRRHRS